MTYSLKLSLSTAFALIMAVSFAQAQDNNAEEAPKDKMMEEHGMEDGNMSDMKSMMVKMEAMMESCTEMMEAKKEKSDAEKADSQDI